MYIGRPCYHGLAGREACTASLWTSGRYSETVVESLAEATSAYSRSNAYADILLIGYSGGGVLATLVASRLDNVIGIMTVAANLDVEAWAAFHRYDPLTRSLNPADFHQPERFPRSLHLFGELDAVVPSSTTDRYFLNNPTAVRVVYPGYDHVCCWIENWPAVLEQALPRLSMTH